MSIEQARAFFEKVINDEDLQKKMREAQDPETKLAIARQEGFEFGPEEAKQILEELSDGILEQVSAGMPGPSCCDCAWLLGDSA